MQVYLGSSLVVIGQLVEVFIVPFFILMSNVHRENMQTQKNIKKLLKMDRSKAFQ